MALVHPERTDDATRREIAERTRGYADGAAFFVDQLAEGVARIAAAFYPRPVIVRLSDFKTNEYAGLLGGALLRAEGGEPDDRLPRRVALLPRRATARASRSSAGRSGACARRWGSTNVIVMIPFCRTVDEAVRVQAEMAQHGLRARRATASRST